MPDITISTKDKQEEKKEEPSQEEIKSVLRAADEYQKLKEYNDKIEAETKRTEELLKSQSMLSGRAKAGQYTPEKTKEELAREEAASIIKPYL